VLYSINIDRDLPTTTTKMDISVKCLGLIRGHLPSGIVSNRSSLYREYLHDSSPRWLMTFTAMRPDQPEILDPGRVQRDHSTPRCSSFAQAAFLNSSNRIASRSRSGRSRLRLGSWITCPAIPFSPSSRNGPSWISSSRSDK